VELRASIVVDRHRRRERVLRARQEDGRLSADGRVAGLARSSCSRSPCRPRDRPQRSFTLSTPPIPAVAAQLASLPPDDMLAPLHLVESLHYDSDVRDDATLRDFELRPPGLEAALDAVAA
jgi:hypothetical protein